MRWYRRFFRRRLAETQLDAELRFHLVQQIRDYVSAGLTPDEARRRARLEFGGLDQVKEECREVGAAHFVETVVQDARYGLRMLGRSWGLTAIVALTLVLGLGINTAIFSVLNGWLLRPLPVRAPDQIVVLASHQNEASGSENSYSDLVDLKKQATTFSDLFAYATGMGGFSTNGHPTEFAFSAVTGNYFSALGLKPAAGRLFLPGEGEKPGDELGVVLGNIFWQKRFGGNPGVVGKQVRVNGKPATVMGVAPQGFHGTFFSFEMDGYLTLNFLAASADSDAYRTDRSDRNLMVLGRLKPGVSLAQAQSAMDVVTDRLAAQYPVSNRGVTIRVIPERLARPAPFVVSFVPMIASLFLVLPALVLLLACMNVANILLARATVREGEMAVRAALGAGRGRLIRQMLTESLILAFLGALGGVVLGEWAIKISGSFLHSVATTSSNLGFKLDCSLDWRVFGYALAATVLTGIFVGVWPALRASRADLDTVLHAGARGGSAGAGRHWVRNALVLAQVAGSLMLLIVAGLFVRSLVHAEHMDLGFDPNHVLNVLLDPRQIGYDETRARTFYRELEDRVRTLPGVESASLAYTVPLSVPSPDGPLYLEGRSVAPGQQPPDIPYNGIGPAYFETMRIPLLEGRAFVDSDNESAPLVAIVNQTMARRFWPRQNPIGKRFSLKSASGPFIEVVGLARDGQSTWMLSPGAQPYFYLPLRQNFQSFLTLEVRSVASPQSLVPVVQQEIHKLDPDLPIMDVRAMRETVQGLAGFFVIRLAASLAGVMGILGLTLAVVGVYGVVSFAVDRRTHEIGIRMALGAERGDILKLALRQGVGLVMFGIVAGLLAAVAVTHAMAKLLMGVSTTDPVTYALVSTLLLVVALLASYIPARRAARVDPMVALRRE